MIFIIHDSESQRFALIECLSILYLFCESSISIFLKCGDIPLLTGFGLTDSPLVDFSLSVDTRNYYVCYT